MKAALIPPKGYEYTALSSNIHLGLPLWETRTNPDYIDYLRAAHERGDYIIMDNGCAEGKLVDSKTLMEFAHSVLADEVVAPDVMGFMQPTLTTTMQFVEEIRGEQINVMGVLQGQSIHEIEELLSHYVITPTITAVGIPKVHVKHSFDHSRANIARLIMERYPGRFEIHLLGNSKFFPSELYDIPFPEGIRSMDSALPYKATEAGTPLVPSMPHPKRRGDYFLTCRPVDTIRLKANILVFRDWAEKHG